MHRRTFCENEKEICFHFVQQSIILFIRQPFFILQQCRIVNVYNLLSDMRIEINTNSSHRIQLFSKMCSLIFYFFCETIQFHLIKTYSPIITFLFQISKQKPNVRSKCVAQTLWKSISIEMQEKEFVCDECWIGHSESLNIPPLATAH